MAVNRVTPSGWLEETSTTITRVTPSGWVQETTGAAAISITATAATWDLSGAAAEITHSYAITATAAVWDLSGVTADVAQPIDVTATAAVWDLSGVTADIAQTSGLGGRLIARHRSRTPWWDEDEVLAQLCWALGVAPPERDRKSLRDAAKQGLTKLLQTEPYAISRAEDGALLLESIGRTMRLQGALKRHVERVADEEDFETLLDLIA